MLQSFPLHMRVGVVEAGDDAGPAKIDLTPTRRRCDLRVGADRRDDAVTQRNSLGAGSCIVEGDDGGVAQHQRIGAGRHRAHRAPSYQGNNQPARATKARSARKPRAPSRASPMNMMSTRNSWWPCDII